MGHADRAGRIAGRRCAQGQCCSVHCARIYELGQVIKIPATSSDPVRHGDYCVYPVSVTRMGVVLPAFSLPGCQTTEWMERAKLVAFADAAKI